MMPCVMPNPASGAFRRPRLAFRTLPIEVPGAVVWRTLFSDATTPAIWLDSSSSEQQEGHHQGHGGAGRFSILCDASGPGAEYLRYTVGESGEPTGNGGLFAHVARRVVLGDTDLAVPEDWPCEFALGWVGAWGYELRHLIEPAHGVGSAQGAPDLPQAPDAALIFATRAVVIEHGVGTHLMVLTDEANPATAAEQQDWLDATDARLRDSVPAPSPRSDYRPMQPGRDVPFRFVQSKQRYLDNINRCLEYIAAGDSYEICLTNTAIGPSIADIVPLEATETTVPTVLTERDPYLVAFERLRAVSPVPYGVFARFPGTSEGERDVRVLGASPERFLKVSAGGHVSAKPIKGTRPRATSPAADAHIADELRGNPKDRAENLMIVDLLRNDIGRVCTTGSVQVPVIFDVETYSHVHQLVSTIEGQLAPGHSVVDLLVACFPGGSMTGAPKVRTMEIIAELEGMPRGLYSGAIGWLSPTGAADLSITIRTLVDDGQRASFGVGGAIVADSDPEAEFEETLVKASALLDALGAYLEFS